MFNKKTLLITGGTGSFGRMFIKMINNHYQPERIIIYSRDEMKQWDMQVNQQNKNLHFVIGDVRDRDRLTDVMQGVDFVVHAAATKIVPTAETNPEECVKTNINGALNVIAAAKAAKIQKVVALSTDKASNPINLYGATKLASDKLFIAANQGILPERTIFSVVRYGNVMGSRGSVIPFFLKQQKTGTLTITDKRMTRFMIPLEDAVELVLEAFSDMTGGELYVKKIPSMNILDIAKAVSENCSISYIGIRNGEKLHEQMIGADDANFTFEYENYFKILPSINGWNQDPNKIKNGALVSPNFIYTSDNNSNWMTVAYLRNWIRQNSNGFLDI